jgi:23S rRNA maturation-related 3'-5' exoribonuclease YhaM
MLKRKRKRSLSKVKTDIRALPEENDALTEADEEVDEYVLDMEDIVLEENVDTDYPE